jgi:hypothetical protein
MNDIATTFHNPYAHVQRSTTEQEHQQTNRRRALPCLLRICVELVALGEVGFELLFE